MRKSANFPKTRKVRFSCQTSKVVPEPLPFSAPKSLRIPARRARHRLSPLCHRSLLVAKAGPVPEFRSCRVFRGPTARRGPGSEPDSPPRFLPAVRPPSLSPLMSPLRPAPFLVQKALIRRVRFSQMGCLSLKFRSFSVESRLQKVTLLRRKTGEFQPAEVVTVCHRFVTALFGAEKCAKAPVPEGTWFLASLNQ